MTLFALACAVASGMNSPAGLDSLNAHITSIPEVTSASDSEAENNRFGGSMPLKRGHSIRMPSAFNPASTARWARVRKSIELPGHHYKAPSFLKGARSQEVTVQTLDVPIVRRNSGEQQQQHAASIRGEPDAYSQARTAKSNDGDDEPRGDMVFMRSHSGLSLTSAEHNVQRSLGRLSQESLESNAEEEEYNDSVPNRQTIRTVSFSKQHHEAGSGDANAMHSGSGQNAQATPPHMLAQDEVQQGSTQRVYSPADSGSNLKRARRTVELFSEEGCSMKAAAAKAALSDRVASADLALDVLFCIVFTPLTVVNTWRLYHHGIINYQALTTLQLLAVALSFACNEGALTGASPPGSQVYTKLLRHVP